MTGYSKKIEVPVQVKILWYIEHLHMYSVCDRNECSFTRIYKMCIYQKITFCFMQMHILYAAEIKFILFGQTRDAYKENC